MTFSGGCLCGSVRYRIDRKYLNAMHCYCSMCRKAHGTALSTHVMAKPTQIVWDQGRKDLMAYESSPQAYREFCGKCGTHILVHGQSGDATLAIPAGTLDGAPQVTIRGHMFVDGLVPWHAIIDDMPQYTGWPPGFGKPT